MTWAISLGRLIPCKKIGNAWIVKSVNEGWDYMLQRFQGISEEVLLILMLSYVKFNKQYHNK